VVAVCHGSIACPVAAMKEWLGAAGIAEGPVFRRVGVKAYAARLGLDAEAFSGHSLRSAGGAAPSPYRRDAIAIAASNVPTIVNR
jgi:hypothetical protein